MVGLAGGVPQAHSWHPVDSIPDVEAIILRQRYRRNLLRGTEAIVEPTCRYRLRFPAALLTLMYVPEAIAASPFLGPTDRDSDVDPMGGLLLIPRYAKVLQIAYAYNIYPLDHD